MRRWKLGGAAAQRRGEAVLQLQPGLLERVCRELYCVVLLLEGLQAVLLLAYAALDGDRVAERAYRAGELREALGEALAAGRQAGELPAHAAQRLALLGAG